MQIKDINTEHDVLTHIETNTKRIDELYGQLMDCGLSPRIRRRTMEFIGIREQAAVALQDRLREVRSE